jgi:D-glycero-D-manno-heptose 1,7-bisphosphate phosphatase
MMREIGERFHARLEGVPAVGDSLRDLQAAVAVGARPILVLTGKGERTREAGGLPEGTRIFPDLAAVADDLTAE